MPELEEENINPDSWTQKELLKHVYREVMIIKDKINDDTEMSSLKDRVALLEQSLAVWEGKRRTFLWMWGGVMTALVLIIEIVLRYI